MILMLRSFHRVFSSQQNMIILCLLSSLWVLLSLLPQHDLDFKFYVYFSRSSHLSHHSIELFYLFHGVFLKTSLPLQYNRKDVMCISWGLLISHQNIAIKILGLIHWVFVSFSSQYFNQMMLYLFHMVF